MFSYEGLHSIETIWEGERLRIIEPLIRLDISAIAACFERYGHHPILYLLNRMKPRANNRYTLLGNFAGTALDTIVRGDSISTTEIMREALRRNFREKALEFVTCPDFNPQTFKKEATLQVENMLGICEELFRNHPREEALLEPSFVCPALGIQGRVDLMTSDLSLLVEQKSGKTIAPVKHYVQVLLYYGVLATNFGRAADNTDIRLLYSKFPLPDGLRRMSAHNNHRLMLDAIELRNQIVAMLFHIAREGFESILPMITTEEICYNAPDDRLFHEFELPQLERLIAPIQQLKGAERDYFCRMMTFVIKEKLCGDTAEDDGDEFDYRRGDMVYVFSGVRRYGNAGVRGNILYKGTVEEIAADGSMDVRLNDGDKKVHVGDGEWLVEHATSDATTGAAISSLYALITAEKDRRDMLLGRRETTPEDFALIVGPPGTGKTSQTLRRIVEEHQNGNILLMAYTNRAVDEICAMLESAGKDYLRIGNENSCDPAYRSHLLSTIVEDKSNIAALSEEIERQRIVVCTTSTLAVRPFLLAIKSFSLTVIDEASQILEPNIIGILANKNIGRFILIGDHKQLPAVVQQPGADDCRRSLFERLIETERRVGRNDKITVLRRQGRMHPDIAALANDMFYREENIGIVPLPHQTEQADYARVLFINSMDEARDCARKTEEIYRREKVTWEPTKTVGIIVTYRRQIAPLRKELERLGIPDWNEISIDTVERYQGSQRDVIIFSTGVKTTAELAFLTENTFTENGRRIDRKLNVAITRARKQFILIGNDKLLRQDELYNSLIELIQQRQACT